VMAASCCSFLRYNTIKEKGNGSKLLFFSL
jgi:hypothetical protein